jgi:transglutaminase-like putative cysteine protease
MNTFIFGLLLMTTLVSGQTLPESIQDLIDRGEFTQAQNDMRQLLAIKPDMDAMLRQKMIFEIERLERIRKDFSKDRSDIIAYISRYIPDVEIDDLLKWEESHALEVKVIDGQKRYFHAAARNLFRIVPELRELKKQVDGPQIEPEYNRIADLRSIVQSAQDTPYTHPTRLRIDYRITVPANTVPDGQVVRAWLPFPKSVPDRQTDIHIADASPVKYLLSPDQRDFHRSIYFEQVAREDSALSFKVSFEMTHYAYFQPIDADRVSMRLPDSVKPYLQERPPHIVFTPEMLALSRDLVGDETHPYRIAQQLFGWISDNIPWASAREYSTFTSVCDYVLDIRHADCGMQTIFLITLMRMNGIPARWQSGWWVEPSDWTMHDWGEFYLEPYGWLPMDVTFEKQPVDDPQVKWFFLGGMDTWRWIVNDDFSVRFYPAKIHPRSETIDFQRGEVEWAGGNLYFDQWDWDFNVKVIDEP